MSCRCVLGVLCVSGMFLDSVWKEFERCLELVENVSEACSLHLVVMRFSVCGGVAFTRIALKRVAVILVAACMCKAE